MIPIKSSEITPEHVYLNRRQFLKGLGLTAAGALVLSACGPRVAGAGGGSGSAVTEAAPSGATTDELGAALTPFEAITNYNNYYEFSTDKETVAPLAKDFPTSPWSVQVGGMVKNPKTYAVEDLLSRFTQQ